MQYPVPRSWRIANCPLQDRIGVHSEPKCLIIQEQNLELRYVAGLNAVSDTGWRQVFVILYWCR